MSSFRRAFERECKGCRNRHFYKSNDSRGQKQTTYYCVRESNCEHEDARGKEGSDA